MAEDLFLFKINVSEERLQISLSFPTCNPTRYIWDQAPNTRQIYENLTICLCAIHFLSSPPSCVRPPCSATISPHRFVSSAASIRNVNEVILTPEGIVHTFPFLAIERLFNVVLTHRKPYSAGNVCFILVWYCSSIPVEFSENMTIRKSFESFVDR